MASLGVSPSRIFRLLPHLVVLAEVLVAEKDGRTFTGQWHEIVVDIDSYEYDKMREEKEQLERENRKLREQNRELQKRLDRMTAERGKIENVD